MTNYIAFQGELGAYSHQACRDAYPDMDALACKTFEDAIEAVHSGQAALAMLPVENTTFGRVPDIHQLIPNSGLHIVGEAFVRVHINLWGIKGSTLDGVTSARSHPVLLGQCRTFLQDHTLEAVKSADTAGSALEIAQIGDPAQAALASDIAGEIYGLDLLARHIEDHDKNTTRFLVMAPQPNTTRRGETVMMTSFVFRVRNLPAALYKAMGGFATNGINMTKLESYMVDGEFTATQFYADIEGHPDDENVQRAMDELAYFTDMITVLGVYPADAARHQSR